MSTTFEQAHALDEVPAVAWNTLTHGHPLLDHGYLSSLEESGCVNHRTGWTPRHLIMKRDREIVAAMPLYLKNHSRGEYVFDQSWAHAFERHGLHYYPKAVCAIPFTPVTGPRLLAHTAEDQSALLEHAIERCAHEGLSSLHVLFPPPEELDALQTSGLLVRKSVQFHWMNTGYSDYNDFLMSMSQPKRKKIRQDTRKCEEAGVRFEVLENKTLTPGALDFFYRCYRQTYFNHGQLPYLNRAFFSRLHTVMPEKMVMVLAYRHDRPVAAAMNIRGPSALYGRYWGCLEFIPGLHFETCYMRAIRYCIERNLKVFEGGAQGEHKLARGLSPTETFSGHWIADTRFKEAIENYLQQETRMLDSYTQELEEHSPFKAER